MYLFRKLNDACSFLKENSLLDVAGFNMCDFLSECPRWVLVFSSPRGHVLHRIPTVLGQQEHGVTIFVHHYLPKPRENKIIIDFTLRFPLQRCRLICRRQSLCLSLLVRHAEEVKMDSVLFSFGRTLLNSEHDTENGWFSLLIFSSGHNKTFSSKYKIKHPLDLMSNFCEFP